MATYGCESRTLGKNEDRRFDAFEMKGLRKIAYCKFRRQQRKQISGFSTKLE